MMNCHIKRHIDDAIDTLIGGNWDASLYTADSLLEVIQEYNLQFATLHPYVDIDDCADFLEECAF